uniref:Uncharacterized protein n=1 Tax=Romanomermis culicivorax TaxID=13658 RepID=A0A915ITJ4_ROMCU
MIKFLSLILFVRVIFIRGKMTGDETLVDRGLLFTKVDLEDEFVRNKIISLISYSLYINTITHNETCRIQETIDKNPEKAWLNSTINEKAFIEAYIVHVSLKKTVYKQDIGAKKFKCRVEIEERRSKNGTALSLVKVNKIQCPIPPPPTVKSDAKDFEKKGLIKTLRQLTEKFAQNKDDTTSSLKTSSEITTT